MNAKSASASNFVDEVLSHFPSSAAAQARAFATSFFDGVAGDDLSLHDASVWAALLGGLIDFVRVRPAHAALVRVFNPEADADGWRSGRTILQIAADDMPFLVDSVGIAAQQCGVAVHGLIHPIYAIARDGGGHLLSVGSGKAESVMHVEVDRLSEPAELERLRQQVLAGLGDVACVVEDWPAMRARMADLAATLGARRSPLEAKSLAEAQEFLRWAAGDHFTFLGYREYRVAARGEDLLLEPASSPGLGLLRKPDELPPRSIKRLIDDAREQGKMQAIVLTQTHARSTVHRAGPMDYIGVLELGEDGMPVAEHRFIGLYASGAYTRRPWEIPLVRHKYEAAMARAGHARDSHSGKTLRHVLETLPREELFQASEDELFATACAIMQLQGRSRTRLFVRRDRYGRFYSCLIYVPRERFSAEARERIETLLKRTLHGERVDSSVQMDESPLARLHLIVRPRPGDDTPQIDIAELEAAIARIVRNWHDELREALVRRLGQDRGAQLAGRYGKALPAGYIEQVSAAVAAGDVEAAASLKDAQDIRLSLYRAPGEPNLRFKLFRYGAPITLSEVLPMFENLGLKVLAEHPYEMMLDRDGEAKAAPIVIQDFQVQPVGRFDFDLDAVKGAFQTSFERVWRGQTESDGFNRLILGANLDWRQVAMLRGLCKYLLQVGVPFSQSYMEETLNRYPLLAALLVVLFETKFDPARDPADPVAVDAQKKRLRKEIQTLLPESLDKYHALLVEAPVETCGRSREEQYAALVEAIRLLLDRVAGLDEDRILRAYLGLIEAMLRTSFFQTPDGRHREYIAFKFDSAKVPELPKPKPYREIFVYAPRVEGVHLRFGKVARGGLRWSDRREDFRTEVLGLVKAQMVKNTVIVPVGSKGGFFVKRPPAPTGNAASDRDAQLAEGIACYRLFIHGLLDITDNLVDGKLVPPRDCVRHDGDDPYLVVAADKGTATFSDIANEISAEHGFWLGDAFASGGSVGYDHKAMGITAKGAWESVKRHFRVLGRDCQTTDFTCVGIGDMSGDVFGNGMLLSGHTRLIAAFDHRHIFLDPNPDAAASFAERERLFKLPRSSWADYEERLISAGGGIFPRSAKSVAISAQARAALGLADETTALSPNELMRAILMAPVDLLWNGGIGTYVKAQDETHAEAGDRANNAIRVDGKDLRCKLVGEGGNLGFTQRGRIEAALHGVLLNTDFIDNSAGVDTSDHEVNIKILLNDAVQRGELTMDGRNRQLAAMTDEVAQLVLADNYRQNQAISVMERMSVARLGSEQHFIRTLEAQGLLDRQIEFLPGDAEFAERKARGQGLTRPELSVLLSYAKIVLFQQLLDSDVPEDPYLSKELRRYFPAPLHDAYAAHMERHRLKREIIATAVTNSIVNRTGATFVLRLCEDTGKTPAQVARAYNIAREVFDARQTWAQIEALDGKVRGDAQIDALLVVWQCLRGTTRWLLHHAQDESLDIARAVGRYHEGMRQLRGHLPATLTPNEQAIYASEQRRWAQAGFPEALGSDLAALRTPGSGLDIIHVASERKFPIADVARVYFGLAEALDLNWLMQKIRALPVESQWHAQARGGLRDELYAQHRALTAQVLAGATGENAVAAWLGRDDPALKFTLAMFADMRAQSVADYPIVSVAVRRLAQLVQAGAGR